MKTFLMFILISVSAANAQDGWLCEQEAGIRDGKVYAICGIGESLEEQYARARALTAAIEEFETLCDVSSDCFRSQRVVIPKRTACEQNKQGLWKCYRLIEVTLK